MKRRISKRVREQAALICAIAASSPRRNLSVGTYVACDTLGLSPNGPEEQLAAAAFHECRPAWARKLGPNRRPIPVFAEAEALLRTGWTP